MDPVKALQEVGWSELEARVYVSLIETGEALTGYQVAKVARVARANVYPVLERLVRRGALIEEPHQSGPRYRALPFATVSEAQMTVMQKTLTAIEAALPSVHRPSTLATARGEDALLAHGLSLVNSARLRLDVGASEGTIRHFSGALAQARERGVSERFLCFDHCPPPGCGVCQNPLVASTGEFNPKGWLVLLRDDEDTLISVGSGAQVDLLLTNMDPVRETLKLLFRAGETWMTTSSRGQE